MEVVAIDGDNLHIKTLSRAVCSKCEKSGGCKNTLFALFKKTNYRIVRPPNLDIAVKDRLVISLEEHNLNKATTAVYLIPLVSFILGLVTANMLALTETIQIVTAAISLAGGTYLAKYYLNKNSDSYNISITKKVT